MTLVDFLIFATLAVAIAAIFLYRRKSDAPPDAQPDDHDPTGPTDGTKVK